MAETRKTSTSTSRRKSPAPPRVLDAPVKSAPTTKKRSLNDGPTGRARRSG